jgi:hypothetical protein
LSPFSQGESSADAGFIQGAEMSVNAQYVGFKSKATAREYTFLVTEVSTEPLEIIFTIQNEAFSSRRLSFQNGPDICSLKLHREMADSASNPLKAHYRISEADLASYHDSHAPKAAHGLRARKAGQSF